MKRISRICYSFLRVPVLRYLYVQLRLHVLLLLRGMQTLDSHGSISKTSSHNLKSLRCFTDRNERLLQACLFIEGLRESQSLVIGCRTEEEIFLFKGYGIANVKALDISSYSRLIELGDMHKLPYADNSFDFIFCAYTLSYSANPRLAATEMVRVARQGGTIAIAIEYCPWDKRGDIQDALLGYRLTPGEKLENFDDVAGLFGEYVDAVFVRYDAVGRRHHTVNGLISDPSPVIAVFSVRKPTLQRI